MPEAYLPLSTRPCTAVIAEIDLAMLQLFGGCSDTVIGAYDNVYPLDAEWRERVALYQLYPLLVHLNLFGGTYRHSVEVALKRYA